MENNKDTPEYIADFLWPYDELSVEEAGYEFANAQTEEYRQQWWNILVERIKNKCCTTFFQQCSVMMNDDKKAI